MHLFPRGITQVKHRTNVLINKIYLVSGCLQPAGLSTVPVEFERKPPKLGCTVEYSLRLQAAICSGKPAGTREAAAERPNSSNRTTRFQSQSRSRKPFANNAHLNNDCGEFIVIRLISAGSLHGRPTWSGYQIILSPIRNTADSCLIYDAGPVCTTQLIYSRRRDISWCVIVIDSTNVERQPTCTHCSSRQYNGNILMQTKRQTNSMLNIK